MLRKLSMEKEQSAASMTLCVPGNQTTTITFARAQDHCMVAVTRKVLMLWLSVLIYLEKVQLTEHESFGCSFMVVFLKYTKWICGGGRTEIIIFLLTATMLC